MDLSSAAIISKTYCNTQVKELVDEGIVSRVGRNTIMLTDAGRLRISLENSHGVLEGLYYFTPEAPKFCAKRIDEVAKRLGRQYSITGELGLWSYYKHVQPLVVQVYVKRSERELWENVLEHDLKYYPCPPNRATLILLPTNDPYPFMRLGNYDGYMFPQFIQVYLDCFVLGGRLSEGAKEAWKSIRG